MSQQYPASEDLEQTEENVRDFMNDEFVKEAIRLQEEQAMAAEQESLDEIPEQAESPEYFDSDDYDYSLDADDLATTELPDFTYADPYDIADFKKLTVCKTAEFDPSTGIVQEITADPDDPTHVIEAMSRSERSSVQGLLHKFETSGVTSTSQISEFFFDHAMKNEYKKYGLKSAIVSNVSSGYIDIVRSEFNTAESHSYIFSAAHKDFHKTLHQCYLVQMNHRITQEAAEKNRHFFPSGQQRNPDHMQDSFTWDKFEKMAAQCMSDAFKRANYIVTTKALNQELYDAIKPPKLQFNQHAKQKIIDTNMFSAFEKTFSVRKGEKLNDAVNRIRSEFKPFAKKQFEEYDRKGLKQILAQGVAMSRGSSVVKPEHLETAAKIFKNAEKNPVRFNSLSKIVHQVTGNDKIAHKQLMHAMDGRSSFQRSRKDLEKTGMHLHALSEGRTRIRKEDRIHGQAFAASATLGVPQRTKKEAIKASVQAMGYTAKDVLDVRKRMQKAAGRIKDDSGKEKTREQLLDKVKQDAAPDQSIDKKPRSSWQDDQDDGYSPDGPGGGKGRKPRR